MFSWVVGVLRSLAQRRANRGSPGDEPPSEGWHIATAVRVAIIEITQHLEVVTAVKVLVETWEEGIPKPLELRQQLVKRIEIKGGRI